MATPYFLFDLNQNLSAIDITHVVEVSTFPGLTPIPDAPMGIVGVVNLREELIPIVDLQMAAGESLRRYQSTDRVMILRHGPAKIGLVVNAVHGLQEIAEEAIQRHFLEHQNLIDPKLKTIYVGMVTGEETITILSAPENWISPSTVQAILATSGFKPAADDSRPADVMASSHPRSPGLDPSAEQSILYSVVKIGQHLWGLDSQLVREFLTLAQVLPVPCCPAHILGVINLRGDLLTVVDVCQPLHLLPLELPETPKAIVIELETMAAVLVVEDILEVMLPVPMSALKTDDTPPSLQSPDYSQGQTTYNDQPLYLLNLPALFTGDALVVNESL